MQPHGCLDRTQMLHTHSLQIFDVSVQFETTTFDHKYMIIGSEFTEVSIIVCITTEYIRYSIAHICSTLYDNDHNPKIYTLCIICIYDRDT
jgi:hypothetical protein